VIYNNALKQFRAFFYMKERDIQYMNRAIELAERGKGWVNPNPLVGAVIVKEGKVIGEGWHECFGGLHAERNAFKNCSESAVGATLYVTLEPCCHYGKTPPCTEAVIEHRIARVVIGLTDPNPLVAGKGVELLRKAGIEVVTGVEEEKVREQNRIFLKYITTGKPWVVLKTAMTLDGKIATCTGDSMWVSGEQARKVVQEMRCTYQGIMVGSGTVKADDPLLNCRLEGKVRQPVRIVVDSKASVDLESRLVKTAADYRLVIAHTMKADVRKLEHLRKSGVETLVCREQEGHVDLLDLSEQLGRLGIDSVLLEGGGQLNEAFLRSGLVDEVWAFVAPKILGGREAKTAVEGEGIARMSDALVLHRVTVDKVGEDILIKGRLAR
jgi:diaminohydroxyphosphoribosylaminopyrimidine deaminase/5-amino-6-(5-phosphoribosylamino)uracil reductase